MRVIGELRKVGRVRRAIEFRTPLSDTDQYILTNLRDLGGEQLTTPRGEIVALLCIEESKRFLNFFLIPFFAKDKIGNEVVPGREIISLFRSRPEGAKTYQELCTLCTKAIRESNRHRASRTENLRNCTVQLKNHARKRTELAEATVLRIKEKIEDLTTISENELAKKIPSLNALRKTCLVASGDTSNLTLATDEEVLLEMPVPKPEPEVIKTGDSQLDRLLRDGWNIKDDSGACVILTRERKGTIKEMVHHRAKKAKQP